MISSPVVSQSVIIKVIRALRIPLLLPPFLFSPFISRRYSWGWSRPPEVSEHYFYSPGNFLAPLFFSFPSPTSRAFGLCFLVVRTLNFLLSATTTSASYPSLLSLGGMTGKTYLSSFFVETSPSLFLSMPFRHSRFSSIMRTCFLSFSTRTGKM